MNCGVGMKKSEAVEKLGKAILVTCAELGINPIWEEELNKKTELENELIKLSKRLSEAEAVIRAIKFMEDDETKNSLIEEYIRRYS